jgi:hypothetical protein
MTKAAELAKMGEVLTNSQIGGRRNIILNPKMAIAQRGTSSTGNTTGGYKTVDRFKFDLSNLGTHTFSQSSDAPIGFKSALRIDCTTADASPAAGGVLYCVTGLEGQDLQQLKKGTSDAEKITISFYVKSNKTGTYVFEIYDNDNTKHIASTYTISSADTWEQKTITFAGDTSDGFDNDNGGSMYLFWWIGAGTNYTSGSTPTSWASVTTANRAAGLNVNIADNTANDWAITGVQLEVGSQATPFEHRSFGEELALCQRYFELLNGGIAMGASDSATTTQASVQYKQSKRAGATIAKSGTVYANDGATQGTVSGVANSKDFTGGVLITFTTSSISNNEVIFIYANNEADGITADAEL